MNKAILAVSVLALFCVSSCKKDSTTACKTTDDTQTYQAKVKPILDTYCITSGCHDAGTSSGGVTLTTYNGAVDATKSHNLISQIQSGIMPQLQPKLPDSLINKIVAWRDNCYQQ
jgi:hypothetical protein